MDFSSQPQNVKIEIAWLGECWNILKSRMGEFIAMGVIAWIITSMISFAIRLPIEIVVGISNPGTSEAALGLMGLSALVGVFANVLAQGIAFVLTAGIMIFTLKLLRGEAARFEDLFLGFKNFGTYFVAGIIIGVASFLGVFACIIGTVFVQGLLMFVAPLIYDRNLSAMDAAKQSVEMLKSQWAMAGAYYFITALFAFVGVFACCIGIIVTAPILYIAQALAYHKFAGSPTGEAFLSPSGYPRDPSTMGNMPEAPTSWTVGETPAPASEPAPSIDPEPPSSPEQPSNVDSDATTFENPAVDGGDSSEDPKGPG